MDKDKDKIRVPISYRKPKNISQVFVGDPCKYPFDVGVWVAGGTITSKNGPNVTVEVVLGTKKSTHVFHWTMIHVPKFRIEVER